MFSKLIEAIILGIVEGVTEFLPISSTGHLILTERFIRFDEGALAETFVVFVQLGAILAVIWLYWQPLLALLRDLLPQAAPSQQQAARRLAWNLFIAFTPAAAIGFFIHDQIKVYLFNPPVIAAALIVGGLLMLWVERRFVRITPPHTHDLRTIGPHQALAIGVAQVFSLVPGVSRSAATILGGMLAGLDRAAATEFSFWLAIPVLVMATLFDLVKSLDILRAGDLLILAVGCIVSFIVALVVIRALLRYVQTNTFEPFAYYRIVLGLLILLVTAR